MVLTMLYRTACPPVNEEPIAEPTPQECVFGALFESTPVTAALVLDDKVAQYFAFAQWLGDQPHAATHARGGGGARITETEEGQIPPTGWAGSHSFSQNERTNSWSQFVTIL